MIDRRSVARRKELHRIAQEDGVWIVANCKCKSCKILSSLDAERFDLSYKDYPKVDVVEPVVEPVLPKRRHTNDDRDKLMFNAGRWAGGARDKVAADANTISQLLMDTE